MIAVAGGKGGTGKTTTALGYAATVARQGAEPVVVDTDRAMPNLHVAADTPASPGVAAVAAGRSLADASHPSPVLPGVRVLPTPPGTDERTLRRALSRLSTREGVPDETVAPVLLDCPAGAGRAAALPLQFASRTVLVSTPQRASLVDAVKTAAMARALDAPPVGCVLTRTTAPPSKTERLLGCPLLACIPTVSAPLTAENACCAFDEIATVMNARNV